MTAIKRGRPYTYNWDDWFQLDYFLLERGTDYTCGQSTMAQAIRSAASKRHLSIRLQDNDTSFTVTVVRAGVTT